MSNGLEEGLSLGRRRKGGKRFKTNVAAWDCETGELVAAGRFDVVESHAGAAPGDLAFGGEDTGGVHLAFACRVSYLSLSSRMIILPLDSSISP